jgi:putative DNA primase/helicase
MSSAFDPKWIEAFRQEAQKNGLIILEVIPDGNIHRCGVVGDETGKDGSYAFWWNTGWPGGWGMNFKGEGESFNWFSGRGQKLNAMELAVAKENERVQATKRKEEQLERYQEVALKAKRHLKRLPKDVDQNPYLERKGVRGAGDLRVMYDNHFVPVFEMDVDGKTNVISAQIVPKEGKKMFLTGGKTVGGFFPIGNAEEAEAVVVCEGIATGLSIHEATGYAVFCAFGAHNVPDVTATVTGHFSEKNIIVAGDDGEAGRKYSQRAAMNCGVKLVLPIFKEEGAGDDFNDLHQAEGLEQVKAQVQAARRHHLPMGSGVLHAIGFDEFIEAEIPVREMLLYPCVPMKGIVMVYAERGLGKTYVGLTMALAIATAGTALRWTADKARKVLYIDGEMPAFTMQERFKQLMGAFAPLPDSSYLRLVSMDYCGVPTPNLTSQEGQKAIDAMLGDTEVVFLDNLSTLCGGGDENSAESWDAMQAWLLSLRHRGVTVIFIHHANKDGGQRGTSRREDILDTTIALHRIEGQERTEGARFQVSYEKNRGFFGDDAEPYNAELVMEDGVATWAVGWQDERTQKNDERKQIVAELLDQGMTVEQMAEELGMSSSTVGRIRKKVVAERKANGEM